MVLRVKKLFVIEQPLLTAPTADFEAQVLALWNTVYDAYNVVACLILWSMTLELHRQFENSSPYDMIKELKSMFEKQAEVERFDLIQTFYACKQEEGKSVSSYVLKMKGYFGQLECLGYVLPQDISVGLILNGLTSDFVGFVRNYNMDNIGKTIYELHALLIKYEKGLPKKATPPQVMAIQDGRIQKANKKSLNYKGKSKGKGNRKDKSCIPKPKKPYAKEHFTRDDSCHYCKEVGRYKRNCPACVPELIKKKKQVGTVSSSDRGGEYISLEFKDYLKAYGISQQLTPPCTPQHNGVSERRNRTLLDMVLSMMNLTTLPLSFWNYAIESATHILNMVPTKNVDKTPYEISAGYENQRIGNVAGARETVGSLVVQKSGIQCYNYKEFRHVARDCQKPKRAKDVAYHREKMLLCKQEEARIQLNTEQADWRDDTDDDELEDQELEAHYMYMAQLQEVSPDAAYSGPIFDDEPLQKVSNDDHYNVFSIESSHPEKSKSMHDTYPSERELLASLIEKLKCEIDESKNPNKFLETSNKSEAELARRNSKEYASQMELECEKKEAQIKLYKTREDKELDKVIELEQKVKVLDNIVYKTGQYVQTMNMLNNKCRTSFAKPEFLKKAQRANPRLYDIGCYNENLALMLAPGSDDVIRLEKESRSKLSDLIRPFDYDKLNNLYDLFVPQREKSSEQRYFSEISILSHINVNNGKSKESFKKQTTLLEKRMDESISLDKKCQSSIEIFKVKTYVNTIITGVELCKQKIANRTYIGYFDPFIQNTIESNFSPVISRINAGLDQFHRCLNEEMVADLRYFNSLELEVDSLRSQLETQKT
uniref:Integrase catalytic domain-containing protein n=1 Tax=Tanacetum cinerariifolium TaxID=118510 RepID=A0A6L2P5C9_TANCI|nr:hypothetical protein [Tanacetum cinerariifolium]